MSDAKSVMTTAYSSLVKLLDEAGAHYRLIDHPPEGRTVEASLLRDHPASQAAKCIVARVEVNRQLVQHALAVIPGDRRTDLGRLTELLGGRRADLAPRTVAEALTGCVSGSIMPFSFNPELSLIVDPDLLAHEELFFNAARLDRSIALATDDYLALARPRVEPISYAG